MNLHDLQTNEFTRRANAFYQACKQKDSASDGINVMPRRQFLKKTGAVLLGASLGTAFGSKIWPARLAAAHGDHEPVPIPGGTPLLGGRYHVYGPVALDPVDAEPATITDFNGFLGLAYISGMVTRTNTRTGEVRTLPFLEADMRFMKGVFRGKDGQIHEGAFGFV